MRNRRARLLRTEAHERYDDGERNYEGQLRQSFYRRTKDKWTRYKKVG